MDTNKVHALWRIYTSPNTCTPALVTTVFFANNNETPAHGSLAADEPVPLEMDDQEG